MSDVVAALTDTADVRSYMRDVRRRDQELDKGWGNISHPLSFPTAGGPQNLACANTEGLFRLIQAISSPKAEPFKRWLAKVGYERVQEIENPELGSKRTHALYKAKGYSDDWIEKRMPSIAIRDELTEQGAGNTMMVDVSGLPPGILLVRMTTTRSVETVRLVKE
ncbi:MAG: hypothetical protein JNM91_15380 [Flavobacteriales bacterium]|nr:hypothetical protein [Flavobacteriales bacterium]